MLTEKEIKSNNHIPTDEILRDISDTRNEIKDYEDEKSILMRNPQENKVRIYMIEGNILKRQDFINNLQQIIDYRTATPQQKEEGE